MTRVPDGTGLVLLPGMMCDARLFDPQRSALAHWPLMDADLSLDATIPAMARRALAAAPWPRLALCGLSMGGIVAMEMVRQAPDRVAGLALLDTNHLPDDAERRAMRKAQIARVRAGELAQVMARELKPFYVAERNRGDRALHERFLDMAMGLGPQVFERQARALMAREGAGDVLASFTGPSLVLCGAEDVPCPPARHDAMHELLDGAGGTALRVTVEGAGHITTLERPDAVCEALTDWLARLA